MICPAAPLVDGVRDEHRFHGGKTGQEPFMVPDADGVPRLSCCYCGLPAALLENL